MSDENTNVGNDTQQAGSNESQSNEGQGQQQAATETHVEQKPAAVAQPALTPEAIAEAMKQAGVGQPQKEEKKYSEEDFDKTFNVFKPNSDLLKAIREGDEEAALAALYQVSSGAAKQAVTMAAYLLQQQQEQMNQQFNPVLEYYRQQQETQLKEEFLKQHEDLVGWDPILHKVVADLQAELKASKKTLSKEDAFKVVAERARAIKAKLPLGNNSGTPAGSSQSSMSTLSAGGHVGSKGGSGGASKLSPGHSVFR